MQISENVIEIHQDEIPFGITLQGVADLLAPHFGGDRAMHHYIILEVEDQVRFRYSPSTSEADGKRGQPCCLNTWGRGDDLFFEGDDGPLESVPRAEPRKLPTSVFKLVNVLREERGLPKVKRTRVSKKPRITREVIRNLCAQVWKDQYPRALTDPEYILGELTVKLVEKEVERQIAILKGELIPLKR